jgi:hypothetical protein
MRTSATRHAAGTSALLPSARTDRAMTVEDANANAVLPGSGRLVSCGAAL